MITITRQLTKIGLPGLRCDFAYIEAARKGGSIRDGIAICNIPDPVALDLDLALDIHNATSACP